MNGRGEREGRAEKGKEKGGDGWKEKRRWMAGKKTGGMCPNISAVRPSGRGRGRRREMRGGAGFTFFRFLLLEILGPPLVMLQCVAAVALLRDDLPYVEFHASNSWRVDRTLRWIDRS